MSLSVFSPDILPSPFMATDQLITSLAYSGDIVWGEKQFSLFLVPKDSVLYPTSLLGTLYAYLKQHPHIKRILTLRQGEQIETICPSTLGVDFVLGKQIFYDQEYYTTLPIALQSDDTFPMDTTFWASHVLYTRLLEEDVKLVPLCLGKEFEKNDSGLTTLFDMVFRDSDTVCVLCQNVTFSGDDKEEIILHDTQEDVLLKSFYSYADKIKRDPTLLQSELVDTHSQGDTIYQTFQGIFAL